MDENHLLGLESLSKLCILKRLCSGITEVIPVYPVVNYNLAGSVEFGLKLTDQVEIFRLRCYHLVIFSDNSSFERLR